MTAEEMKAEIELSWVSRKLKASVIGTFLHVIGEPICIRPLSCLSPECKHVLTKA